MRLILLCLCCILPVKALAEDLVVFAAASLKGPLDEIAADIDGIAVSYAGSGTLARQIASGAPADVVLLANKAWTDLLMDEGHIGTPVAFASNRLVLIGQPGMEDVDLTSAGMMRALNGGRIAMGFTQSVPAGIYARAAFMHLDLWDDLASSVVETQNVRAALALVARGEAPLGVVYQSDALITPDLPVVAQIPKDSHPQIAYFAAVTTTSDHAQAEAFVARLQSRDAQAVLEAAGFCTDLRWC